MDTHREIHNDMEETLFSSCYNSNNASPEPKSPNTYKDFCNEMETDKTVNSTMIEDFKENINISHNDVGKCMLHPNCITQRLPNERSLLALGPRKSYQQITNTYYQPVKSFWWKPAEEFKKTEIGFHQKDDIFKELSCDSCSYTTFQKKSMAIHISKWHTSKILNIPAIVSKETINDRMSDKKGSSSNLPTEKKPTSAREKSKVQEDVDMVSIAIIPKEGRDYRMKDVITKELRCNFCGFELFGKKKMHVHLEKFHKSLLAGHVPTNAAPIVEENIITPQNSLPIMTAANIPPSKITESSKPNDYQNIAKGKGLQTVREEIFEPVYRQNKKNKSDIQDYVNNNAPDKIDKKHDNNSGDSALSSSFDKHMDHVEYNKSPLRKNKRVTFHGERSSPVPKRRLVSPQYVRANDS